MARARNIKHGFFTNDKLAECSPLARILFAGLWTIADREGRLEDRPRRIKAELLPYDDCSGDELLSQLANAGFIQRYTVGGSAYIQIINFLKHQNPHVKEAPSTIPALEGMVSNPVVSEQAEVSNNAITVQAPDKNSASTVLSRLIPDSGFLIPDTSPLIPDSGFHSGGGNACAPAFPYADFPDGDPDDRPRIPMTAEWQPGNTFLTDRTAYGFKPESFSAENLAEFRGYWAAKPDRITQAEWEHRLAVRLKEISSRPPPRASPARRSNHGDDLTERNRQAIAEAKVILFGDQQQRVNS